MNTNNWSAVGLTVGFLFFALVVLGGIAAWNDKFFSVSQMYAKGFKKGLAFIFHGGMWGDIVLSIILGIMTWKYGAQWTIKQCMLATFIGIVVSGLMHVTYIQGGREIPEAWTYGGRLPAAGLIHAVFFAGALGTFVLFYFFTKDIDPTFLKIVGTILAFHILAGTHMILGALSLVFKFPWLGKNYLADWKGWIVIFVVWALIAVRSWLILKKT